MFPQFNRYTRSDSLIEMIRSFGRLKKNPKAVLLLDPLWTIPFNLYLPFATLYMFALGLGDVEIGILLSVGMFANFIMALLGGVITDKFGRKRTLLWGDFIAWSIPVLILAFAQNFWWFLIAALFNSIMHIAQIAFECCWLDDMEEDEMPIFINLLHILWLTAVFAALVSGFFVERYSLVPVMRILYLFAFVVMTGRLVIMKFVLNETKRGNERMEATKESSIINQLSGYKDVFLLILKTPPMRRLLILLPMVSIFQMITGTFFALYMTQDLQINEYFLAYFPVIRAGVGLLFFFFIQNRLGRFKRLHLMGVGMVLFIAGHIMLLTAPPQNIPWLLVYALMDAWAAALFFPRLDALVFSSIDAEERARCRSLINVLVLAIVSPFGFLAGYLSDINRRLPFGLNMVLFACMICFLLIVDKNKKEVPA